MKGLTKSQVKRIRVQKSHQDKTWWQRLLDAPGFLSMISSVAGVLLMTCVVILIVKNNHTTTTSTGMDDCIYVTIKQTCSIKDTSDYKTSRKIGIALENEEFEVLDVYADYINVVAQVPLAEIDRMGLMSISGYVWNQALTNNVIKFDTYLKEEPTKKSKTLLKLPAKTIIARHQPYVTWIKVQHKDSVINGIIGWIYVGYTSMAPNK